MDDLLPFFRESTSAAAAADLGQLEFDEMDSENGGMNSIPDEDIYDAVNDETFGAEVATITADDADLEGFSTRTANLALFDDPNCSIQLPDPSQIPIPNLRNDLFEDIRKDPKKDGTGESLSSIWASGSFNGIGSLTENYIGHLKTECQNASRDEQKQQLQQLLDTGLSSSISHSFIDERSIQNARPPNVLIGQQQKQPSHLPKMPVPNSQSRTSGGTLSVEELERRMLIEAASANTVQHLQAKQFQQQMNVPSECLRTPSSFAHSDMTPLLPPHVPPQQFLQQLQQINRNYQMIAVRAVAAGLPPPPFPPLPLLHHPTAPPMPPLPFEQLPIPSPLNANCLLRGTATPTTTMVMHSPMSATPTSSTCDSALMTRLQSTNSTLSSMPQLSMIPSSLHPQVEGRRRQRQGGLPSGKTISDFALDPYAGFMSTKEREWLIKIHIIQCLGSGDPYEDDFYYSAWKQRNVLQKAPEHGKDKEKPKYYKFEATFPSSGYTAPSFLGSLGKPIHSSASQPRQIIEVNSDGTEDLSQGKNRQKRLRAALLKIENGALALLDCQSIRRKLRFFEETRITEYLDPREITGRTARFVANLAHVDVSLFSADTLPTMMLVQKGRRCIYEWLKFWGEESDRHCEFQHIYRILSSIPKFGKKMPEETLKQFVDVVSASFSNLNLDKVMELLGCTSDWELHLISDSKLVQLILLKLTVSAIDKSERNLRLNDLLGSGAAKLLHELPDSALRLCIDSDFELFKPTQWTQLRQWLIREQSNSGYLGSNNKDKVAQWIMQNQSFVLI